MGTDQGIEKLKFTNKRGVTLTQPDWIAGVDYDSIDDVDVELQNDDNQGDQSVNEAQIDQIFENDPVGGNLDVNDLEENENETENEDMELVIDEMIDELNNEIIPAGEELLSEIEDDDVTEDDPVETLLRPTRERKEPVRLTYSQVLRKNNTKKVEIEQKHNLFQQAIGRENKIEYRDDEAPVVARFLDDINLKYGFGQQYMLEKGLKKFGTEGIKSTEKEIGQLHDRNCFRPVHIKDMTQNEQRKAQIA